MSRWCPACRREWADGQEACPSCFAELVDDLDATIVCRHCGTVCPARMQSCPSCLGELRPDAGRLAEVFSEALAHGQRLPRPADVAPFSQGADCTLLRISAHASLLYCGVDELVEAAVEGDDGDHRAVPPLRCTDFDGSVLFRLERYEAADDALVAFGADGASLATYLRVGGRRIQVRDETSAPAATLRPARRADADYELVETGGGLLATCSTFDADLDGWIDDQWSLRVASGIELPVRRLAAVGLLLAAKVLLGRPSPVSRHPEAPGADEDSAGRI